MYEYISHLTSIYLCTLTEMSINSDSKFGIQMQSTSTNPTIKIKIVSLVEKTHLILTSQFWHVIVDDLKMSKC